MIAAFDVGYSDDGSAQAAAVVFENFSDGKPLRSYLKKIAKVAEYVPGSFCRRELPCILELFSEIEERIDIIIIDGYVSLGDRPGLGKHLSESIAPHIAVIGVAKKIFQGQHSGRSRKRQKQKSSFCHRPRSGGRESQRIDRVNAWALPPADPSQNSGPIIEGGLSLEPAQRADCCGDLPLTILHEPCKWLRYKRELVQSHFHEEER